MLSRRAFVAGGVVALPLVRSAQSVRADEVDGGNAGRVSEAIDCLDYGLSFVCNTTPSNSVRFWIESRTTITNERTGVKSEFYQCGSCKSENTFGKKDLFLAPNYDFLPILGGQRWLIFRRPAGLSPTYRMMVDVKAQWGEPILMLRKARRAKLLSTWEAIRDATAEALPIVAQTELRNAEMGLRAVMEYPVKTMNVSLNLKKYQVDTGPVAYPDLSERSDSPIECLSLAFVAFNAPDFADFVVEQPTPVVENGHEVCKVYHYSSPFSLSATNCLLALDTQEQSGAKL